MIYLDSAKLRNSQQLHEPIKTLCSVIGIDGAITLLHEFSDGFSETRVVLAEVSSGPTDLHPFRLIFKIGSANTLRDEINRYLDFIPHARASAAFVPIRNPELTLDSLPSGQQLSAIAYGHAADVFGAQDCIPLRDVIRDCVRGDRPVAFGTELIERLGRVMTSLYAAPTSKYAHEIALYYLEHWAPDYQVSTDQVVEVDGYPLLTLDRLNPAHFNREFPSEARALRKQAESPRNGDSIDIVLPRCVVARADRERIVAWLNSPGDLTIQIDTSDLTSSNRERLSSGETISLWAPKKSSRYDFYLRQITSALPSFDANDAKAPTFEVGQLTLPNPLAHLSEPLVKATRPPSSTLVVPAHGDFHPGNVLAVGTSPVIIDYGKAATSIPIAVDAARFFGGLVRDALALELSFEELAEVLADVIGGSQLVKGHDTPCSRAVTLLQSVMDNLLPAGIDKTQKLWPIHLYGYSLIGLKWRHSPITAYQACFLLAAVALQRVLGTKKRKAPAKKDTKQKRSIAAAKAIKREGPAEILILVSRFAGSADYDPVTRIYSTLADNIFDVLSGLARVERIEETPYSRQEAINIARTYGASMIVWGTFDNLGIAPRYEVTRDSLVMKRSMIQLDEVTRERLSERFEPYITQDLAAEMSFLSLKLIAEICVLNLNFEAGIKAFNRALSLIPSRKRARKLGAADIYRSLAAVHFALIHDEDALQANSKALELEPDDFITQLQGLFIRARKEKRSAPQVLREMKMLVRKQLDLEKDSTIVDTLKDILKKVESLKTPEDVRKLLESGGDAAKPPVRTLNQQFQKDVVIHLQRAHALLIEDRFAAAIAELKSAIRLNPRCEQAFVTRARAFAYIARTKEAMEDLEKAERMDPNDSLVYSTRGRILVQSFEDYEGALKQFERAFELNMPKQSALPDWGIAMVKQGRGDEAMDSVRKSTIDPTDPRLFIFRSYYFRDKQEYDTALREADQAIELSEEKEFALWERAEVYGAMGRWSQAEDDVAKAIELAAQGTFTKQRLIKLGEEIHARAISSLRKCRRAKPGRTKAKDLHGKLRQPQT